ncbi:MAG: hypothetical protein JKX91_12745 [Rhizobiaceae bacterium]|nr:hypothetical protein [Rhizobiaceae bacterium]
MLQINSRYINAKGLAAALSLTAATLFLPDSASAQSIQCASAIEPSELEICNNEDLIMLDEQMSRLNSVRKISFTNQPKFQSSTEDSQAWIEKRNLCGLDASCIELRYFERLNEISKRHTLWAL